MYTPFQLIQEFKFTEAVGLLASTNVSERGNIIFQLKKADGTLLPYAAISVNALEALCFMNSVLSLTSNSLEQLNGKGIILKNCIKAAYNKMKNYDNTIWDGRDNNGNSTAQWLAWGGAAEQLRDLLNKHPELIEDEKKLSRNVFDVTIEVEHLNVEQKKELAKVLIPLGIQINNLNTYNIILQNKEYLECLKSITENASNLSLEIFTEFANNAMTKIGSLITNLKKNKVDISTIKNYIEKGYEIVDGIFKYQDKINIEELLHKDLTSSTTYVSSFLHWLLEFGNTNLTSLLQNYDQNKKLDFYVKDWNGKAHYRSVLEWIANYRLDILKDLLEHKPPLFNGTLKDTKIAIANKIAQESLNAKEIPTDVYM